MNRANRALCVLAAVTVACGADDSADGEMAAPSSKDAGAEADGGGGELDAAVGDDQTPAEASVDSVDSNVRELTPCALDTGYDGDDACMQAPEPDEGFQLHYGPTDYDDSAQIEEFVLEPGAELLDCQYLNSDNEGRIFYDYFVSHFRPLTHHMIVDRLTADVEDGHRACGGDAVGTAGMVGGSTVASEAIGSDNVAPENRGLAAEIPARAQMSMQVHFFNFTDQPILREAWMNVYYKDPATVETITAPLQGMSGLGGLVAPGETGVWQGRMEAPQDVRVINLYSHFHSHTVRMSAWKYPADGSEPSMVYETFDWQHPDVFAYDSVHDNRPSDRRAKTPGAHTGQLNLLAGDALVWECEIVNDDLDIALRWANEALTAEMCILRGNYAPSWGEPWSAAVQ